LAPETGLCLIKGKNKCIVVFDLIVIGGGAAGFYGALQAAEIQPGLKILILEKSTRVLSKVRVSGGGRCNVTHSCFDPVRLSQHYPRGEKVLRRIFKKYDTGQTVEWFQSRHVVIKTEADGRMFPVTDDSQTIIDCFLNEARRRNVQIQMGAEVHGIDLKDTGLEVSTTSGLKYSARRVLVATGGSPKREAYSFIEKLGHKIRTPIPSLFTFNDSKKIFVDLMGVSVANAEVRIARTSYRQVGAVLITHWGLSGPAVIRLSAWAAEHLHAVNYQFLALVSWVGSAEEETMRSFLLSQKTARARQKIHGHPLFNLPQRLWVKLCDLSEIPEGKIWSEIGNKNLNRLLEHLIKCPFQIKGKTTFKEEFVTCGGVDFSEIDPETLESKFAKGVYFAGEVLNEDGETGGFNFQAAWSTASVAARAMFLQK
jgi:predicted Rossmann fold flavoprotein